MKAIFRELIPGLLENGGLGLASVELSCGPHFVFLKYPLSAIHTD